MHILVMDSTFVISFILINFIGVFFILFLYYFPAASYTPFFKESWEKKLDTEHMFQFSMEDNSTALVESRGFEAIRSRPPASLPKGAKKLEPFGIPKSSTSNRLVCEWSME